MLKATRQHPNAVLTPSGRARIVRCMLDLGWTVEATAERFQVDAKTVRKWRDRFLAEGPSLPGSVIASVTRTVPRPVAEVVSRTLVSGR